MSKSTSLDSSLVYVMYILLFLALILDKISHFYICFIFTNTHFFCIWMQQIHFSAHEHTIIIKACLCFSGETFVNYRSKNSYFNSQN